MRNSELGKLRKRRRERNPKEITSSFSFAHLRLATMACSSAPSLSVLAALLLSLGIALVLPQLVVCVGGEIGPELLKAIETSRIAVVVFSKSYATSDWCLDELVKILECKRLFSQSVPPIAYDVSQSVVLEQKGIFAEALLNGPVDKVNNWTTAMMEAANLTGFHLEHRPEPEFIEETVEIIWKILYEESPTITILKKKKPTTTIPPRRQNDVPGQYSVLYQLKMLLLRILIA